MNPYAILGTNGQVISARRNYYDVCSENVDRIFLSSAFYLFLRDVILITHDRFSAQYFDFICEYARLFAPAF